jgi:hypothetical protein
MEESQRETGKFGRTDLIEMPRSGCERPMAFASGGDEFRISPLGLVPALSIRRVAVSNFAAFKPGENRRCCTDFNRYD